MIEKMKQDENRKKNQSEFDILEVQETDCERDNKVSKMPPYLLSYNDVQTLGNLAKMVGNVGVRQFLILFLLRAEDPLLTLVFLSIHVLVHLFYHPKLDIISEHGVIISEQVDIISEQAAKIGRICVFEGKLWYFMETRIVKV